MGMDYRASTVENDAYGSSNGSTRQRRASIQSQNCSGRRHRRLCGTHAKHIKRQEDERRLCCSAYP